MRDGARFPIVPCNMTETAMRADCDATGGTGQWRVTAFEKHVPMSPMNCLEISSSNKVVLFNRTVTLTANGMAVETLEERINYGSGGGCPGWRGRNAFREAYTKMTIRKVIVWKRQATESLIKKTITLGANDILPNFVAGRMDATEGTYVWNHTVRSSLEEELEELYKGRMEQGVTICGRKMRQAHLPLVYVEWNNLDWKEDASKRYAAPAE
jgi:hypothetical protein